MSDPNGPDEAEQDRAKVERLIVETRAEAASGQLDDECEAVPLTGQVRGPID